MTYLLNAVRKGSLVYLAGPMTGIPDHNAPEFDRCKAQLINLGFRVVSPMDISRGSGQELRSDGHCTPKEYALFMKLDIAELMQCQAIVFMSGYRNSRGCKLEFALGKTLLIPMFEFDTGAQINDKTFIIHLYEGI